MTHISGEVIIVDNNSVDGSIEMVEANFAEFQLIVNKENVGFSKANNQAIRIARGEFILLLNPDTVVSEDTFEKVIAFMEEHTDAGGLGIRMIDGKGNFLPESKRGLPRPSVAFYKIFGLSKLFPKSTTFGQYHAGHLSDRENNEVDILSGAFMLMRKTAIDKVGMLDEDFFMYGEDIDLSYRIQKGGFKNYYFADSEIIHYKGESTKKSSVNYVFVFYRAMVIFAKKHFTTNNAKTYSILINFGIYLRAFFAIFARFIKGAILPAIDYIYIVVGLFALTNYWQQANIEFPEELIKYSIPVYALTWLTAVFFNGGYDEPIKLFKFLKGVFWGTIFILIVYAVLPKSLQFSRLFIFIGSGWIISYYFLSRIFLHFFGRRKFRLRIDDRKKFALVGNKVDTARVSDLLKQSNLHVSSIQEFEEINPTDLREIDEVVFCANSVTFKTIIQFMSLNKGNRFNYKIASENGDYLIGSNSIDTAGDLYILDINMLVNAENKRKKRLFDFSVSTFLLLFSPIIIFSFTHKKQFFDSMFAILVGKKSFIGFSELSIIKDVRLPKIKPGILNPSDIFEFDDVELQDKMNLLYARDYSIRKDLSILTKSWRKLDR